MVSTRAGGKRAGDTVQEDERPAKQTKLEDHGVKEDSPEIQAIDPPKQQKAEEQPEEKQESDSAATDSKEADETPAASKSIETEDAKQANKDLEREEEVLEHGHVYFFYKPKVLCLDLDEFQQLNSTLPGRGREPCLHRRCSAPAHPVETFRRTFQANHRSVHCIAKVLC